MRAFYNEIDGYCCDWLSNLMDAGMITPGHIDKRSIVDVRPGDVAGFERVHFFAGIGVWDYALNLAGWGSRGVTWTGSCPCQPFSAAGKRGGTADERHLWPAFFHLIRECRPATVLGEQVASKDGLGWLDLVHADLEGEGCAVGAADLCAAGVGAPHIRQRLWFVADANGGNASAERQQPGRQYGQQSEDRVARLVADTERVKRGQGRLQRPGGTGSQAGEHAAAEELAGDRLSGRLDDAIGNGRRAVGNDDAQHDGIVAHAAGARGFWSDVDWIPCRDGKARPVEPGTFPLAHGIANRVGRLRAYGNAICAPAAATFIASVLDVGAL